VLIALLFLFAVPLAGGILLGALLLIERWVEPGTGSSPHSRANPAGPEAMMLGRISIKARRRSSPGVRVASPGVRVSSPGVRASSPGARASSTARTSSPGSR
jgi:hypothetical protein